MVSAAARGTRTQRHHRLAGEAGAWVFIAGDMFIFSFLFVTFAYYRSLDVPLYESALGKLDGNLGLFNTAVLLVSSLLVVFGVEACRHGAARRAAWLYGGAILCGLIFACAKYVEYSHKFAAGITIASGEPFMFYFVMTAIHLVHVMIGVAFLSFVVSACAKKGAVIDAKQIVLVEGASCFWHLVDLLWILIFALLYLAK